VIYPNKPVQVPFYKIYFPWLDLAILTLLIYGQVWLTSPIGQYQLMNKGVTVPATVTNKEVLARNGRLIIQSVYYSFRTQKGEVFNSYFLSPYGMYDPLDQEKNKVAIVYLPTNPSVSHDKHSLAKDLNDLIFRVILPLFAIVLVLYLILSSGIRQDIRQRRLNRLNKEILGFD